MFYRLVTYKEIIGLLEMPKQLLPSVLLKTEGSKKQYYKEEQDGAYKGLDAQTKTVYVYDRSSKQWYTISWIKNKDNNGRWYTWCKFIPCRKPYLDFTSTAVVGSQKPNEDMIQELEDLFQDHSTLLKFHK
ncbi:hypothetical protein OS493_020136 [Desmophyllum pertusum]|uniref:Uncharacterized protein n=1 Tax=Desmophyllum pertusum TaxID=174260 RepID=A0A9X0A0A9_9CNID|nr:hypothetical protein OS493_020136 [Desmophyllum pertusum]